MKSYKNNLSILFLIAYILYSLLYKRVLNNDIFIILANLIILVNISIVIYEFINFNKLKDFYKKPFQGKLFLIFQLSLNFILASLIYYERFIEK